MLYSRYRTVPGGPPVRVRLAHAADRAALAALLARRTAQPDHDLAAARLVRFDPRREMTLCATTWDGGHEALAGVAVLPLDGDGHPTLLVEDGATPGAAGALLAACAAWHPGDARAAG